MKKSSLFLTLALAALMFAACPTGDDDDGGGPVTPPNTVLVTPVAVTGNSAYYYSFSQDYYKGVFIENRTVTLSPFYLAKYETTYELWYEVYQWATTSGGYTFANPGQEGHNGTAGAAPTEAGKTEPVTTISWRDAVVWCNAYSEKSGKEPVYYTDSGYTTVLRVSTDDSGTDTPADKAVMKPNAKGWRLPTEAEWEYAARGGGTPSPTGSFAYKWAGTNDQNALGNYAWYYDNSYNLGSGNPDYGTHTVGIKTGNGLGLYDMSGNVGEWCWDRYSSSVGTGTVTDPKGPTMGARRVGRGGGWNGLASICAVARRYDYDPDVRYSNFGFRLALCP